MGFAKSWNSEVIAQFYATCYFTCRNDEKVVHWMTEGNWYGISYRQFASLLGFDHEDTNRVKIHISPYMEKKDMKFMYIPGKNMTMREFKACYPSMRTCTACLGRHLLLERVINQTYPSMAETCSSI